MKKIIIPTFYSLMPVVYSLFFALKRTLLVSFLIQTLAVSPGSPTPTFFVYCNEDPFVVAKESIKQEFP